LISTGFVTKADNTSCWILHQMVYDNLPWDEFTHKFRDVYGREMTPDEHRWFYSIWTIVNGEKQEQSKTAAA
jgi:hypothetical protein